MFIKSKKTKKKMHNVTGKSCLICVNEIDLNNNNYLTLHKTRRQTHRLCSVCTFHYIKPIFEKILDKFRLNKRNDNESFECCGCYYSNARNQCKTLIN